MEHLTALSAGAAIGLSIAVPVGPMAVLCINRTLDAGLAAGISTGAGASTVQAVYASVVLLGLQQVGPFLTSARPALDTLSAVIMVFFAARVLRRTPRIGSGPATRSVVGSYVSAVGFNCANPMLLALLAGTVGAVIGSEPPRGPIVSVVLAGVFFGSVCWWIVLSAAVSRLRGRIGAGWMLGINRVSAVGMLGFAALSVMRLVGE